MPAKKYDRDKIKLEFMDSDFKEVAPFLKRKLGEKLARSSAKNRCKGRKEDKEKRNQRIYQKMLEEQEEETVKRELKKLGKLELINEWIINRMSEKLQDNKKNANDIMTIWKIQRTEMGLPVTISKSDATIKQEGLFNEEDFIDD